MSLDLAPVCEGIGMISSGEVEFELAYAMSDSCDDEIELVQHVVRDLREIGLEEELAPFSVF